MPYGSNGAASAAPDVSLARFGLRIVRAMVAIVLGVAADQRWVRIVKPR